MYLLELYYANARLNQTGNFIFPCRKGTMPKWTILSSHPREREKLQLMALSMAGTRCLPHIPYQQKRLINVPKQPLQLEFYLAQHPETEGPGITYDLIGHGLQLYADGRIQKITRQECRYLSPIMEIQKIRVALESIVKCLNRFARKGLKCKESLFFGAQMRYLVFGGRDVQRTGHLLRNT